MGDVRYEVNNRRVYRKCPYRAWSIIIGPFFTGKKSGFYGKLKTHREYKMEARSQPRKLIAELGRVAVTHVSPVLRGRQDGEQALLRVFPQDRSLLLVPVHCSAESPWHLGAYHLFNRHRRHRGCCNVGREIQDKAISSQILRQPLSFGEEIK